MKFTKLFFLGIFILFSFFTNSVSAQTCSGFGVCCNQFGFRCVGYSAANASCNYTNIGYPCGIGGICQCQMSYTRTCNLSLNCVSNACASGDYLIEDYCSPICVYSNQGCGAYGCPSNTERICTNCGSGWTCQCIANPSCVSTPTPTATPPSCNTTAPTGLSLTQVSSNSWNLIWIKGANGTKQLVYVGEVKSQVESNCLVGSSCVVANTNVDVNAQSYSISGLSDGVFYYARVVTYQDATCSSNSSTLTDISSCNVSPSSLALQVGDFGTLTSPAYSSSEIGSVSFTPSSGFISLNPLSDSTYLYSTQVTANSEGTGSVTADVKSPLGLIYCTSIGGVTVSPRGPWWQVIDSDVQSNADLNSSIPSGDYFDLVGVGGYPGVAKYAGSTSLSSTDVSEKGWLANSSYSPSNNRIQNYAYFKRLIPSEVTLNAIPSDSVEGSFFESGGVESEGYFWYEYDGDATGLPLSINSSINLPDGRKVIIFVTGDNLSIEGDISYTSGQSILAVFVGGNIYIDGGVGNLQGFFLSDGDIYTGSSSTQLTFKGSIASQESLILQRDLEEPLNGTTPSEVFEYDPASIFLFPPKMSIEKFRWKEVAP